MATNSSPAVLPISNPTTTTTTDPQQTTTTTLSGVGPTPALRSFINKISETVTNGLSNRRPWAELMDRSAFSKPESISDTTLRIRKNYTYFRINYLSIITIVLAFSLITNPFALLLLTGLLAGWLFLYLFRPSDPPLVLFGRQFSERETLGCLVIATIVVIFLTSVGSVLVSALMIGTALVCTHAAFRQPEDLFLDDQESPATGFLSFLTAPGVASNAAPVVAAARV